MARLRYGEPRLEIFWLVPVNSPDCVTRTSSPAKATNFTFTNDFTKADGVSDVELHGGRSKEIAVKVDRDKLADDGITMNDIISTLKKENKLAPGGLVLHGYAPDADPSLCAV